MNTSEMSLCRDMKKPTDFGDSIWSFGKEQDFKPHVRHVEPILTECDLDWKSQLRWIPEPRYSDAPFPHIKDLKFPNERKLMRSFPQANRMSASEWSFYPNFGQPKTYHSGKRCFVDGSNHTRSMRCISENSLESSMGKKKQATDKCIIYPSTKVRPFLVPEYSPDFHKNESSLRTATFGDISKYSISKLPSESEHTDSQQFELSQHTAEQLKEKENTKAINTQEPDVSTRLFNKKYLSRHFITFKPFIHLKPPTKDISTQYAEKHKSCVRDENILEVKQLSSWRPAPDIYGRMVLLDT